MIETATYVSPRKDIGRGTPLLPDEPRTIGDLFKYAAEKFDLIDALNYKSGGEWKRISSRAVIDRAGNIALGLHSLGLRKGDRAAIIAANSPEWTIADAGCQFSHRDNGAVAWLVALAALLLHKREQR